MKLEASEARNTTGPTISLGVAARRSSAARAMPSCASCGRLRTMSVSTVPGARALTRMPSAASDAAVDLVNDTSAAFAAAYIETSAEKRNAPAEVTFTIDACSDFRRWGSACWTRKIGPLRFTANDLSQPGSVYSPTGNARAFAALFTTMSMPPKRSTVAATSASTASSSPRWVGTPSASAPSSSRNAWVSAHASALRLATTIFAPAAAKPSATARPMPRVPPVMIAMRSRRSKSRSRSSWCRIGSITFDLGRSLRSLLGPASPIRLSPTALLPALPPPPPSRRRRAPAAAQPQHRSEELEDERGAHATAGAHRHAAERAAPATQLVQHRHDHAGARAGDRVTEAAAAAVDVDHV